MFRMKTCLIIAGVLFVLFAGFVGFVAWQVHKISDSYVQFDPATYKGPTGKIVLASHNKEFSVLLVNDKHKYYPLRTEDGTIIAPTGHYTLSSVDIAAVNSSNVKWSATCRPNNPISLSVKQGATEVLNVDQQFTALVSVKQNGSKANFDLAVNNRGDWDCSLSPETSDAKPPQFQVVSTNGDVLWQEKFEFG